VERDLSQADDLSLDVANQRLNVVGDAAFGYADVTFAGSAGGESFAIPARWTVGFVRSSDGWRVKQFHVSVAYGAQVEGESFPS
jgi:ketosteroid isomerase-like protein